MAATHTNDDRFPMSNALENTTVFIVDDDSAIRHAMQLLFDPWVWQRRFSPLAISSWQTTTPHVPVVLCSTYGCRGSAAWNFRNA